MRKRARRYGDSRRRHARWHERHGHTKRKPQWVAPEITDLPRLMSLTLQTGIPIEGGGNTGGGGSSVF
jgi:hypothetical protein